MESESVEIIFSGRPPPRMSSLARIFGYTGRIVRDTGGFHRIRIACRDANLISHTTDLAHLRLGRSVSTSMRNGVRMSDGANVRDPEVSLKRTSSPDLRMKRTGQRKNGHQRPASSQKRISGVHREGFQTLHSDIEADALSWPADERTPRLRSNSLRTSQRDGTSTGIRHRSGRLLLTCG